MAKLYLINKRFGILTVQKETDLRDSTRSIIYECKCDCGTTINVSTRSLRSKQKDNCGCLTNIKRSNTMKKKTLIHGHTKDKKQSPTYISWSHMKTRCYNINHNRYNNYGGKGIKVCTRWLSFTNFLEDMGERPLNTSIGRLDHNDDYKSSNCEWQTIIEQGRKG